jgi:hypothetical protein
MLFSMGTTPRSNSPSATASTIAVTDSRNDTSAATARAARCEYVPAGPSVTAFITPSYRGR